MSILVILSLRFLPFGSGDADLFAALAADQRLADRRLVGELVLRRVGLGRADDRELERACRLLVLDVDDRADADGVGGDVLGVDRPAPTRSRSSSCRMRCSSIACSFLASSYSEFSEMSPNSRASLMRSATSRRFSVERSSSSSLSFCRPSGVRMTSLGMARAGWVEAQENPRARRATAAQCSRARPQPLRTTRAAANESVACRRA